MATRKRAASGSGASRSRARSEGKTESTADEREPVEKPQRLGEGEAVSERRSEADSGAVGVPNYDEAREHWRCVLCGFWTPLSENRCRECSHEIDSWLPETASEYVRAEGVSLP